MTKCIKCKEGYYLSELSDGSSYCYFMDDDCLEYEKKELPTSSEFSESYNYLSCIKCKNPLYIENVDRSYRFLNYMLIDNCLEYNIWN